MSNKFLDKYKNNESLSTADKSELVALFSNDLVFDEVFAKESISPSDIASILQNYGNFWVTIDSDSSNRRQAHAIVVCDITNDSKETCLIKYYDVADGEIKESNFTDFVIRVKDGSADLKTAAVRLVKSTNEGGTPVINLKCPVSLSIKVGCSVDINFILTDDNWYFSDSYTIKLSSSNGISISKTITTLDTDMESYASIEKATTGVGTLDVLVNSTYKFSYSFTFVDDKSVFTHTDKSSLLAENLSLIGVDTVCFRVADKGLSKLLGDSTLKLSSYAGLSGYTRMDDYRTKGYLKVEKLFNQATIWKRHTESGYDLMPFDFRPGQETCFTDFVKGTMTSMGIHVFHYILLNGYHVLLLVVDNTNSCKTMYKILDQIKDRPWDDFSNLDQALLDMTRRNYGGACAGASRKDYDSSINLCKIQAL